MSWAPRQPLVAIIGATGTGKSELAVEIATRFNGEIINGDAMQLYQGLPIITNKIARDEMKGIPHHLLGCIALDEETWTVGKFVEKALGVIENIQNRGKIPILVGGTHYYTQSLLFQDALTDEPLTKPNGNNTQEFPVLDEPTGVILERLKEVDPIIANRWHPNERRKIQRSLEIYLRTGKPASQIYEEQRIQRELSPDHTESDLLGLPKTGQVLRFPTLILWVHADKQNLYERLDTRILKMLNKGLLSEVHMLTHFRASHDAATRRPVDRTRGIWVSIGYKEFLEYQSALNDDSSSAEDLEKMKAVAIKRTQAATRQYANRQIRWIRIKLLNALGSAGQKKNVFLLDGTDLTQWKDHVLHPGIEVTGRFLIGDSLPEAPTLSTAAREMLAPKRGYDLAQRPDLWQKKACDICGTVAVTENDWNLHIKSRGHRRAVSTRKKMQNESRIKPKDIKALHADVVDVLETYLQTFDHEDQK
ncbi:tRNA isopentenyltransferase [Zopfia rhizophila CBS 207.26]|uniref:tRNA dimethylallyltransferase n=1 Tax=Zopfia rhizophila CBS 207.26 TaxID=1314779 RepID=A0A6A6DMW2_9PEZI|nr:tRNA isopentenyltransferase [Zopfia rhizophila CBS 207.26]